MYTISHITDCFAHTTNISVRCSTEYEPVVFKDFVAFCDTIYPEKIKSPWCSVGHIFTVSSENPGKLFITTDNLKTKSYVQNMIPNKRKHNAIDRQAFIREEFISFQAEN